MSTQTPEAVNLDAELQRAIEHHQAGRHAEAEALYLAIVQAQPYHAIANHNVGLLAGQLGFHDAALPYLRTALSVNPDEGQFWLSYANGLLSAQQALDGLEIIESAIQRGLDNAESQAVLTRARAAVAQLPQIPTTEEKQHIVALYQAGRYAEMENATHALLASYPESDFAWSVLGTALQLQGKDALSALQKTVELTPYDAQAHGNLGNAWQAAGQYGQAMDCYLRALEIEPDFAEAHGNLGSALVAQGRLSEAIHAYGRALAINPAYAMAHFNLGNTLKSAGDFEGAATSYRHALAIMPDDAELHANLGHALQALEQLDAALASHEMAVRLDGAKAAFQNNLGLCLKALKRPQDALDAFQRAHAIEPQNLDVLTNLGSALFTLGHKTEALETYQALLELDADNAASHNNLGLILRGMERLDDAIGAHRKALALDTSCSKTLQYLAEALAAARDFDGAASCLRQAIVLQPESADLHNRLGIFLQQAKCYDEALLAYGKALELEPELAITHNNIGSLHHEQKHCEVALKHFRQAIALDPGFAVAYIGMGLTYRLLYDYNAAIAAFRSATRYDSDNLAAYVNLSTTLCDNGQLQDAVASCRAALSIDPHCASVYSNLLFCLTHMGSSDPASLFAEHQKFADTFEVPLRASWPQHRNDPDPERILNVGFVSADFNNHAVANFILPILLNLVQSKRVVLHAYYTSLLRDEQSKSFEALFPHWHAVHHLSDAALAAQIESDGMDILIDLSGHTGGNRLLAFARKPAPVQASWIGYPGTTSLQAMDYFLCDRFYLPPGAMEEQFSEAIAYLPAAAPFLPSAQSPAVNTLPALQNGYITFGSFNRPSKLSREVIANWARLLRALPDSRMLMAAMPNNSSYETYIEWFASEGVARERIDFYPRTTTAAYLALHHKVDLCLDTFPYTGGTTTLHALWMGVPTLTIPGNTLPGRVSACALSHMGLTAFVAQDIDDFLAKGVYIANDIALLSDIRSNLQQLVSNSPMGRPDIIAAGFEGAIRTMWRRWVAGQAASSFEAPLEITQTQEHA